MKYRRFFYMTLLAMLCTWFAACSSDDETQSDDKGTNSLVGTWIMSETNDIYVLKENGSGIGCEDAENAVVDTWFFNYTYSDKSRTVTMESNGDTDIFTGVEINGETMTIFDEDDGDKYTLIKQDKPVAAIIVDNEVNDFDSRYGRICMIIDKEGGSYNMSIKAQYYWHESNDESPRLEISKYADSDNMIGNYSYKNGYFTFSVEANSKAYDRIATIAATAFDHDNNKLRTVYVDICQQSAGNSLEVEGPSTMSAYGGTAIFYVYNKDHNNITAYHPSGQVVKWQSSSTVKYIGGEDWTFSAQIPANDTSEYKTFEYKFVKDDGSSITRTIRQDYTSGGSTGETTGKVNGYIKVIGPGLDYSSYAQLIDGQTCTVDYTYNKSTGKYYVYGGPYCSSPSANGGKGLRFDAQKGYNSICINRGAYFDYSYGITPIKYNWEAYLKVTLP